jgi:hypothetical protein
MKRSYLLTPIFNMKNTTKDQKVHQKIRAFLTKNLSEQHQEQNTFFLGLRTNNDISINGKKFLAT